MSPTALPTAQALLSAALDPSPVPPPSGIGAIAAALRRALRLPGSTDDADTALPPRRRRRVPPVRPKFPMKTKRVVVAPATRGKKRKATSSSVRKPWRVPRFWEPRHAAPATGDALGQGTAAVAVTPFQAQAQAHGGAAEQAQQSAEVSGHGAAVRPLDAQLDAAKQGIGSAAGGGQPQLSGAVTASMVPSGAEEGSTAVSAPAADRANDAVDSAVDVEPAKTVLASPVAEVPSMPTPIPAGEKESAQGATPAAPSHEQRPLPLHPRRRPAPRVWLSGRDPWGTRSLVNGSRSVRIQPANGAVAPPTTHQLPAVGRPPAAQHKQLNGAGKMSGNGAGFDNSGVSNGAAKSVSNGAPANGPYGDNGSAADGPRGQSGGKGAASNGAIARKATMSANAAAALLDARPPVLSQQTAPRPAASSNGLSPGAGNAVRRAPVPVDDASSLLSASPEPLRQTPSTPAAAASRDALLKLDAASAHGSTASRATAAEVVGPQGDDIAAAPAADSASSVVKEGHVPGRHELRQATPGRTQQPARDGRTAVNNVVERRALRLGSPVRADLQH